MRSLLRNTLPVAIACFMSFSTPVFADPDDDARVAFENGKMFFKDSQFAQAADSFRKAYELKRSWKLLYNIGQSEAAAKRYGLALEAFEQYLAEAGDDIDAIRVDEVLSEIKRFRNMVGSLSIKAPDSLVVFVDNVKRGRTPLLAPLTISSGVEHTVVLKENDDPVFQKGVLVRGGQTTEVLVDEDDIQKQKPFFGNSNDREGESSDESSGPATPKKKAGLTLLVTGGAFLVGAGVTGGVALSMNSEIKDECGDGSCLVSQDQDRIDKRDAIALTTDILIGVGAAATIVGVVLLISNKKNQEEQQENRAMTISPVIGSQTVGATLDWRF